MSRKEVTVTSENTRLCPYKVIGSFFFWLFSPFGGDSLKADQILWQSYLVARRRIISTIR